MAKADSPFFINSSKSGTTFRVDSSSLGQAPTPKFQKPQQIAFFSTTSNTVEKDSKSQPMECDSPGIAAVTPFAVASDLGRYSVGGSWYWALSKDPSSGRRALVDPESLKHVCFNLSEGYQARVVTRDENEIKDFKQELMNTLLQCLDKHDLLNKSEFVCRRGILTKVASTPYTAGKKFDFGLKIVAQKVQGVIYMVSFPMRTAEEDDFEKRGAYTGKRFESCVTVAPEPKQSKFYVVVSSKLDSHKLITTGEVDCSLPSNPKHYVELKTTAELRVGEHKRAEDHPHLIFAKPKFLKWWLQSFLIGIEDILYGVRDDKDVVRKCEWLKVSEILHFGEMEKAHWNPAICMKFLNEFLTFAKANISESLVPHVFTRPAGAREFQMTIDRDGEYKFLPRWFVEKMSASD